MEITSLREALLKLHKALMDYQRIEFEKVHGPVAPNRLLDLLIRDEQFAWLHAISELVVRIDELTESEGPPEEAEVEGILLQTKKLLNPTEISEDFASKYQEALQNDPAIVMAHMEVRNNLK